MSKSSDITRRTAIRVAIAGAAAVAVGSARAPRQGAGDMERVQGIGGFFFRAKDPKKLAGWYEANLGVTSVPKATRSNSGNPAARIQVESSAESNTVVFATSAFPRTRAHAPHLGCRTNMLTTLNHVLVSRRLK